MNSPLPTPSWKVVENRTVVEQRIKILWHPHPTIYLLRWWVSEWESTSIRRERLLELCRGQNGERYSRHSEAEWENERTRRRPKADQRAWWNHGRDELTIYLRITANKENWALNQYYSQGKIDFSVLLFKSEKGDCRLVEGFFNFERRIKNNHSQPSHKKTEKQIYFKVSWRQIKQIQREQDSCITRDQHFVAPHPSSHQDYIFCVSLSSLTVFLLSWINNLGQVDAFFNLGKRLL